MQVGQAALDHPALAPEARAVAGAPPGDPVADPAGPQQAPVLVVVIASVGDDPLRLSAGPPALAGDRPCRQEVKQRHQLGDVVALPAG